MTKTILIIEDEKDLVELLVYNLEREGYRAITALDGLSGLDAAVSSPPDLVVLDLMLPGMAGTDVCKALKKNPKTAAVPVIVLTAKGEEIDRVVGFEIGADDYVVKPFSTRELLLRIRAVLRRSKPEEAAERIIRVGPLTIDAAAHAVTIDGEEAVLTGIEFKLLLTLAERLGRLQSREVLLKDVWGYNYAGDTRTVDTHITRLRTKLGKGGELITTIRGFGYKMEKQ
ncbi:MAG TPA: response regulator transcription factor [Geobacteraceae bacterium]|nr:response regulator transcription factor [Geobacteraceae bacterium]